MVTANTEPEPIESEALVAWLRAKASAIREELKTPWQFGESYDDHLRGMADAYENVLSLMLTGKES